MKKISMERLLNLITTWWLENKFSFLRSFAGLLLLQLLAIWFWISQKIFVSQEFLWVYLTVPLVFIQALRISNTFKQLHYPPSSAQWLLLPATTNEKLFSIIVWNSLLFLLFGIPISMLMERIGINIAEALYLKNPIDQEFLVGSVTDRFFGKSYFTYNNGMSKNLWLFWVTTQFIFYWSAIRFRKGSYLISVLILVGGLYIYSKYLHVIKTTLFSKNIGWDGAWELKINEPKGWIRSYNLDSTLITYLQVGLIAVCIYLLYKACTHLLSETKISQ